jgi:hypothetical protein
MIRLGNNRPLCRALYIWPGPYIIGVTVLPYSYSSYGGEEIRDRLAREREEEKNRPPKEKTPEETEAEKKALLADSVTKWSTGLKEDRLTIQPYNHQQSGPLYGLIRAHINWDPWAHPTHGFL